MKLSQSSLLAVLSLVAPSLASPQNGRGTTTNAGQGTLRIARYDEYQVMQGTPMPVPDGYFGLGYRNWAIVTDEPADQTLVSGSSPNRIGASVFGTALEGSNLITTEYPGSLVSSVTLKSFRYGCVIAGGAVGIVIGCTIEVTVIKLDGTSVSQSFDFPAPLPLTPVEMKLGTINPSFTGVKEIRMKITNSMIPAGLSEVGLAIGVDDLTYESFPRP